MELQELIDQQPITNLNEVWLSIFLEIWQYNETCLNMATESCKGLILKKKKSKIHVTAYNYRKTFVIERFH